MFTINTGDHASSLTLESTNTYNDNNWHTLIFSKELHTVKLVIDDFTIDGRVDQITKLEVKPPFYIGGLNPNELNILPDLVCR